MNYGIPYMGSKSSIVKKICSITPSAENFYDLFGGGFSVTHGMLLHRSKDFKRFHFNEIRPGMTELINDAIDGKYDYNVFKPEFISRKKFFEEKETNLYIKLMWSFGNNGKDYLFSKEIEGYKKSLHNAIIFNEFDCVAKEVLGISQFSEKLSVRDKRSFLRNRIAFIHKGKTRGELKQLQQLQQLERLERLQRLQQLQQLQRLEFTNLSYQNVVIKKDSVIYCDIPYIGTGEYDKNKNFNHKEFYKWALDQEQPVFISEYNMPEKKLKQVFAIKKRVSMSATGTEPDKIEKIFSNEAGYRYVKHRK